jgi:hypothetical protein
MNASSVTPRLRYIPIPEEIAEEARETLRDRFGHKLSAIREVGPCRVCLRIPRTPEDLILLSYRPLPDTGPYAEIGPIFIHADRCTPYHEVEEFPKDFAPRRLVLRAYDSEGRIADASVTEPGEAERKAAEFLSNATIAEVHVRHESYTCYDFKIVRAEA